MHPGSGEQTDSSIADDEIKFEFHTVSWENKLLGDTSCTVIECGVQVITAPVGEKKEKSTDVIEEATPLFPREPEEKSTGGSDSSEEGTLL